MKTRRMAAVGGAILLAFVVGTPAQEAFQRVDVRDLERNPQRYWARGIVFEDVLTAHPAGSTLRIDDQTHERLRTKTLGEVYAAPTAREKLRQLPLQKAYLFSGTVLQLESGMGRGWFRGFRGGGDFLYVIQDVSVPVEAFSEAVQDLEAMQTAIMEAEDAAIPVELSPVLEVLRSVEQGLFTFAQDNGVAVETLFDPDSEFAEMPARLALQEIRRMERTEGFSVQLFLADYSISLLRRRYRPDVPLDYIEASLTPDSEALDDDRMDMASLPDEMNDDWVGWFAPAPTEEPAASPLEDSPGDAVPPFIEEQPPEATIEAADPSPIEPEMPVPAQLRFERERLEEVLPEPLEVEDDQWALHEKEEPALSPLPDEEVEPLVLETSWELPEPTIEVPVVVNADLEEFPGLHDPVASRPWDEPDATDDVGEIDIAALIEASPEEERPVWDPSLEALPFPEERLADRSEEEEAPALAEAPSLLPFPIPGTDPIPEPEPLVEIAPEPGDEDPAHSIFVGPFRLSFRHADFLLDRDVGIAAD